MKIYGLRTILLLLIVQGCFAFLLIFKNGPLGVLVMMGVIDLLLFGVITIDSESIKIYALVKFLTGKSSFLLEDIEHIKLSGKNGLTPGRLDFCIMDRMNKSTDGFVLMYPFERSMLEKKLEATGLEIISL